MASGLYKAVLEGRFQQVKFYVDSGVRVRKPAGSDVSDLLGFHIKNATKLCEVFSVKTQYLVSGKLAARRPAARERRKAQTNVQLFVASWSEFLGY